MKQENYSIETQYGIIVPTNYRYFTHRNEKHFFKKYNGFAISVSEVDSMRLYNVDHIVIKYYGKNSNILYSFDLKEIDLCQQYDNEGDLQFILPMKQLKKIGEERR